MALTVTVNGRKVFDARPRPLYIHRPVLNGAALRDWAEKAGLQNITPARKMHVTVAFSRSPVDWMQMGHHRSTEKLRIGKGGPRMLDRFKEHTVLLLHHDELHWRWEHLRTLGCSWDYPTYQPHVTVATGEQPALDDLQPYTGPINLGPEIFEPLDA